MPSSRPTHLGTLRKTPATSSPKSQIRLRLCRKLDQFAGHVQPPRNSRLRSNLPKNSPRIHSLHSAVPDSPVAAVVVAVAEDAVAEDANKLSLKPLPPPQ